MNLNATDSHSGGHLTQREARSAPGATAAAASTAVPRVELLSLTQYLLKEVSGTSADRGWGGGEIWGHTQVWLKVSY